MTSTPTSWRQRRPGQYISGTRIKNYILKDPLIDWLELYYDVNVDMEAMQIPHPPPSSTLTKTHLCNKGIEFENNIVSQLKDKFKSDMITINTSGQQGYTTENYQKTIDAINKRIPIIDQAVFFNDDNGTSGITDLLVRNDYLHKIVDYNHKLDQHSQTYYVVVDIKWSSIQLCSDHVSMRNTGRVPSYKTQLYIYNQALAKVQGFCSSKAFILAKCLKTSGSGSESDCNILAEEYRQLAEVSFTGYDRWCSHEVNLAINWLTDVIADGKSWDPKNPCRWEMYPNMTAIYDDKWTAVKTSLASHIGEITQIWNVGFKNRMLAFEQQIFSINDPRCNSKNLGFTNSTSHQSQIIDRIIEQYQHRDALFGFEKAPILPKPKPNGRELFIDFEQLMDLCL
jgi:hypothetical protein